MGWIIRHSRVGNAQSLYAVERTEDNLTALSDSVKGVSEITGRKMKSARIACKESREEGVSYFLE